MIDTTIDPNRVITIFAECERGSAVEVEAIKGPVRFSEEKLTEHTDEILTMLRMLPEVFTASGGGGGSLLAACVDRNDYLWTGVHSVVERLFLLGMGIDRVAYACPRSMWHALPGGLPYYLIADE